MPSEHRLGPSGKPGGVLYATAVYTIPWAWGFALGVLGIRRIQRISWPAAFVAVLVAFAANMLITSTFVR